MLSMARLLLHTDDVPHTVRSALEAASRAPAERRCEHLIAAASGLTHEAGLDCADARELVGLTEAGCP